MRFDLTAHLPPPHPCPSPIEGEGCS
ncbi:MAG: hypothetical protein JWP16_347, partial [Alphaproteobacteria bacterium]|nr:hypothetical protein [Alphaproteobacteria bacterium]